MSLGMTIANAADGPVHYVLPSAVDGVKTPVISLDGTWNFRPSASAKWTSLRVPGEAAMQGYAIEHDRPFFYKKKFTVPADYAGKSVVLRFDGVYSYARLSVNGKYVRDHKGGFTRWETDVTRFVTPGKSNEIELEVIDPVDEISYASGYAHHPIGGILRDVTLFAVPKGSITDFHAETLLDSLYRDATLRIACDYNGNQGDVMSVRLVSPQGSTVKAAKAAMTIGANTFDISVVKPLKWDAEHPNLYRIEVAVDRGGTTLQRFSRQVGFRDIKIVGNRMLVNGKAVKLRGACRHDVNPVMGRSTTREIDSLDVRLFKQANMNFVRTSHYPPTERFLDFCDRYGIYVESETAVCFVNTHRQKNYAPAATMNNPAYAAQYLSQCQEMVGSFRTHPSVLFWSIGNESEYGTNFQQCYDWVKATDTTRPVILSYPGLTKGNKVYDILSMHYPGTNGNMNQYGATVNHFETTDMPAIFDEWAHPACYTYATLQHDPGIREFWGKSIDMLWDGVFNATGALGGAIWCYADDIFELPQPKVGKAWWKEFAHTAKPEGYEGKCVGYGEWGIVDIWRRKKPEFWATKKAYSPVRLHLPEYVDATIGQDILLTVENRFNHTNLNELHATCSYGGKTVNIVMPDVEPHGKGMIALPASKWQDGTSAMVNFLTAQGDTIDTYRVNIGRQTVAMPKAMAAGQLSVDNQPDRLVVCGNGFEIPFSKSTGLIENATVGGKTVIERGPFLHLYINLNHLSGAEVRKAASFYETLPEQWTLGKMDYRPTADGVIVMVSGNYRDTHVDFNISISQRGEMTMSYRTDGAPNGYLRETGLQLMLPAEADRLSWQRRGYWDCYPDGAFAGNEGSTSLYVSRQAAYGARPVQPWQDDTHDYYYWSDRGTDCRRPLTQKAKGMKENVYSYTVSSASGRGLSVVSADASVACRLHKTANEQLSLYANNRWDYPEIAWGNYCKTLEALPCYGTVKVLLK